MYMYWECVKTKYHFFTSDDVGNWKEQLTVAENEMIDAAIREHLSGSMFDFKYE